MHYLLVKHRVAEYGRWRTVFDSHAETQQESGLRALYVLRQVDDPNMLVLLFEVNNIDKANAFMQTPGAREAGETAGVIGTPEVTYLRD